MKMPVYNMKGEKVSEAPLPKEIFDVKENPDLIWQVTVSQMANRRKVIAHTKNRSEVSGGGKKPWAQKHLGKARHGSIRSPIWRHGGVVFGPRKEKVFKKTIPEKIKRMAIFMVLSAKARDNSLILLDELKIEKTETKLTKTMAEILKKLPSGKESSLIALPKMDKNLILAVRNIPDNESIQAKDLNALDLLSFKYLIMPKESIKIIKETFLK